MKCTIPEISWHNRDPVLSVDIQPKNSKIADEPEFIRLASGGTDSHVLIWYILSNDNGSAQLELAADLARHQRAVNVVRWSPSGEFLASGDDESIIFVWRQKVDSEKNLFDDDDEQDKETWQIFKTLRGHVDDVYDLSWSMDSLNLISGSIDNTAIVWDVKKGKLKQILNDHKGFVQGVTWDPKNQYVATISSDRILRVFNVNTFKVHRRINKSTYPVDESSPFFNKTIRLFHDDTLQTFFRRLTFTPDGELIIVPSGLSDVVTTAAADKQPTDKQATIKSENEMKPVNTTYIFTRYSMKQPSIVIPSPDQYTVAVRCCPLLFELRPYAEHKPPIINLPYRMIFAIATKSSVYLYDTQQQMPFGMVSNIHYARLTDLSWSSDGTILIVSSVDGFCTLITFDKDELGIVYTKNENSVDKENESKENIIMSRDSLEPKLIETRKKPRVISPKNEQKISKLMVNENNVLEIPETIIATTESFESPELKGKPATPIAIRREPRTTPGPSSASKTPKSQKAHSIGNAAPIAIRRQPRNILSSPSPVNKTHVEEEALDAWPIPIDNSENQSNTIEMIEADKTEDFCLVYESESESDTMTNSTEKVETPKSSETQPKKTETDDSTLTPDSSKTKTPRRVQLRTISTPKSKKKLL